ncbi:hypothetical protein EPUS_08129 [Endocarpon pusillum Z07020]|uniref:Uncharacterized protein n=1 Tax=Endocarpon pusillum (strain Z07020 / HMAS-L-300199) TaxID=1263415 RepID=U1GQ38_ENDPU|nr:uncharacterized protein EPUS_08129 [Endocarpon pusillum Z07020]ERF74081.1 hypothetical protein EPUS_08129 [Endocarpon pusillum Z07020]
MTNSPEVLWQSAYFSLVPLAISVMTQPCGDMLLLPSHNRIYLRVSPIVCALDSLAILIRFCVYISSGIGIRNSARKIEKKRFKVKFGLALRDADPDREEISRSLENLTFLRWILFAIGTLPTTIRLLAMGGVPWTKAFGIMFLVSFFVVEIVVVFIGKDLGRSSIPRSPQYKDDDPGAEKREEHLKKIDHLGAVFGLLLHMGLLTWAWIMICRRANGYLMRDVILLIKVITSILVLAKCSRMFRAKILLMSEDTEYSNPQRWVDGTFTVDEEEYLDSSIYSWTMFLVNIVTPLVWYRIYGYVRRFVDHPSRLASQHALARAYQANGQVKEAVSLLKEVVEIREQILAEDHPDRLVSQEVLATIYWDLGHHNNAVHMMKHVAGIRSQVLDEQHPGWKNSEAWLEYFKDELRELEPT